MARASSTDEKPSVGQSGSPSASLVKKSIVSGVISASTVLKVSWFFGKSSLAFEPETPKTEPFSLSPRFPSARQVKLLNLYVEISGGFGGE